MNFLYWQEFISSNRIKQKKNKNMMKYISCKIKYLSPFFFFLLNVYFLWRLKLCIKLLLDFTSSGSWKHNSRRLGKIFVYVSLLSFDTSKNTQQYKIYDFCLCTAKRYKFFPYVYQYSFFSYFCMYISREYILLFTFT